MTAAEVNPRDLQEPNIHYVLAIVIHAPWFFPVRYASAKRLARSDKRFLQRWTRLQHIELNHSIGNQ